MLILFSILTIPRFWSVLTYKYNLVMFVFLTMWFLPFIFLSKSGRFQIGIKKPSRFIFLIPCILLGIIAALIVFFIGNFLFGRTQDNWFISIATSYFSNVNIKDIKDNRLLFFTIYTSMSIMFSPIGEEFFFRGMIHESISKRFNNTTALLIDSSAFATVHMAHHGLYLRNGVPRFLLISGLLWITLMFFTSMLFYYSRKISGSIWGAIVTHVSFNFVMNWTIFYILIN